ncbi:MAG: hypothetical protein RLZZ591_2823 [Pseudomonadota bacterium]|jgi:hypothetical protein
MSSPQPSPQDRQEPSTAGKPSRSGSSRRSSGTRAYKPRQRRRERLTAAALMAWLRKHPNLTTFVSVSVMALLASYLAIVLGAG